MKLHSLATLDTSEGTVQLHATDDSTLILHPRPSPNDPNDPLRWPAWKKRVCFFSICAFTFLTNFAIGGLAPAFYILSIQFDKTQTETSALLLWPILTLGVFNFFWVPIANYFGKRYGRCITVDFWSADSHQTCLCLRMLAIVLMLCLGSYRAILREPDVEQYRCSICRLVN